jgi:acetoin utilization protein AcuC
MSRHVELIDYGADAPLYDHGEGHPLRPARVILTYDLIRALELVDGERAVETLARDATDAELLLIHTADYIEATRRAGHAASTRRRPAAGGRSEPWERYGFRVVDNPIFPQMHEAASRVVGATLTAAEAVVSGRSDHAFNPSGGLHHAMSDRASGFCVYNDPAVAIAWMLGQGVERVAYVDVDVHHGDGVQAAFERDPRVLTISLHQDGKTLFPGTGAVGEMGEGAARGTKVNVPLPPGTGDDAWLRAFAAVVPPLLGAWRPQVLFTQLGCDTHFTDPLANLQLTTAAYRATARALHDLAHELCEGRWVATGGGGYQWARVVPRAWTIYFACMVDRVLPERLPEAFRNRAAEMCGRAMPRTFSEPSVDGLPYDPAVAAVVDEVRARIFPLHGLA